MEGERKQFPKAKNPSPQLTDLPVLSVKSEVQPRAPRPKTCTWAGWPFGYSKLTWTTGTTSRAWTPIVVGEVEEHETTGGSETGVPQRWANCVYPTGWRQQAETANDFNVEGLWLDIEIQADGNKHGKEFTQFLICP